TEWDVMTDLYFYRDPEAEENKDTAVEETKVPGAEEVTAPVEGGFQTEWEVTGASVGAFTAAGAPAAAGASWDADGGDWSAAGAATAAAPEAAATDSWAATKEDPASTVQW